MAIFGSSTAGPVPVWRPRPDNNFQHIEGWTTDGDSIIPWALLSLEPLQDLQMASSGCSGEDLLVH